VSTEKMSFAATIFYLTSNHDRFYLFNGNYIKFRILLFMEAQPSFDNFKTVFPQNIAYQGRVT